MKTFLLVTGLVLIIIVGFSILLFNPDRLTPENPKGKTYYYTMVVNDDTKLDSDQRYEYTLNAYDKSGEIKTLSFTK
ncbi:DUF1093 domain-containing protein [Schinkia azotoformans]|uniref:DUF1093 domain-containing protein n=1 Tax=Schinkia azotoformans TaxID=1454 RepID=UPI0006869C5D|nr:DUF1093 domain-containing protein [Schinkia azotoformans]MEC1640968.1 DUF1093 domain-containing protein [Schinkia azotoformans]MEC1944141.1 DUF1093 domain-containing protein [Schinkia azotoformans]MED4354224.1 DUF1093 domain-containing protein [Schinkia azotoformans]